MILKTPVPTKLKSWTKRESSVLIIRLCKNQVHTKVRGENLTKYKSEVPLFLRQRGVVRVRDSRTKSLSFHYENAAPALFYSKDFVFRIELDQEKFFKKTILVRMTRARSQLSYNYLS